MNHSFDVDIAKDVGVLAATVFNSIGFWVESNRANGRNFNDGSYWTYNSVESWTELFPYATKKQVYTALRKLVDFGLVRTGCYNKNPYDRTLWYTLTEVGTARFKGKEDFTERENGSFPEGKIECAEQEVLNTNSNADDKPDDIPYQEVIAFLNEKAGRRFRCVESVRKLIRARWNEGYRLEDFEHVIEVKCSEWLGTDFAKYIRPSTLFAPSHFNDYVNQQIVSKGGSIDDRTRAGLESRGFLGNEDGWSSADIYG